MFHLDLEPYPFPSITPSTSCPSDKRGNVYTDTLLLLTESWGLLRQL